jgi:hypothetical protein
MTSTLSSPPSVARSHALRKTASSARADQGHTHQPRGMLEECRELGRYTDRNGCPREIVAQRGSAGSVLVVDREVAHGGDQRLVAHLAADEPAANAALECERYLEDTRYCRCRPLTAEDLRTTPFAEDCHAEPPRSSATADGRLLDEHGRDYRLKALSTGMSIPELRWCRRSPSQRKRGPEPVSVRAVIADLEAYEPARTLTLAALARHHPDAEVSTTVLRAELQRVQASPIVLNRGLRETVLAAIQRDELSLSEIAIRCGRVKRDFRGNESGETSWLARRIGILPEGGRNAPTPWIHSDVLALIARRGLAVSPREVELG